MNNVFPQGWVVSSIAQIVEDIQPGFACGEKNVAGGFPHLRMNNIDERGGLVFDLVRKVPREKVKTQNILRKGDVLICTTNSSKLVGKVALFNLLGHYAFSNHLTRLRPNPKKILGEFLKWSLWLNWKSGTYDDKCKHWVNQSTIPKEALRETEIILPPLSEQRRIVAKLEKLLEKVEASRTRLEKIPVLLKRFRQSVLAAACSGRLTEEWRNKRGELRQDWPSVGFFDFCLLQRGYDLPLSQATEGPYPIVTSAGAVAYHAKFKARKPGVVTGRSGSIGRVFFIQEDYWPHNTALYVRDFRGNNPKFVYFFLLGFDTSQYSASTAVPTLNRNNLRDIFVEVPPPSEQKEIVRRVEELFALADRIEARYQKAKAQVDNLTQSILAKAFRGELVPQDPNDEPTSELLMRVQSELAGRRSKQKKRK